jgi:prevent-host-death family protein
MERKISATEARIHFGELMRKVTESGEAYIVERDGKPQVVVLSATEYEQLHRATARDEWSDTLAAAARLREKIAGRRGGIPLPPVEDLIRQLREERDEQLLDNLR